MHTTIIIWECFSRNSRNFKPVAANTDVLQSHLRPLYEVTQMALGVHAVAVAVAINFLFLVCVACASANINDRTQMFCKQVTFLFDSPLDRVLYELQACRNIAHFQGSHDMARLIYIKKTGSLHWGLCIPHYLDDHFNVGPVSLTGDIKEPHRTTCTLAVTIL